MRDRAKQRVYSEMLSLTDMVSGSNSFYTSFGGRSSGCVCMDQTYAGDYEHMVFKPLLEKL